MNRLNKIKDSLLLFLVKNWGLLILICILVALFARNLSFQSSLLGWDNFSVSLNLPINFLRSFSSWREYRGFGVQSDSESVDIFRQIVLFFLSFFLPNAQIDQVYYFVLYAIGVLSTYFLVKEFMGLYRDKDKHLHLFSAGGLLAALFYGLNYVAIDVFYLPIIMYTVRFAFFPLLFLVFVKLAQSFKVSGKLLLGFVMISLLGSPAYLTATVFFTLLILFGGLFLSFPHKIKRLIPLFILFGLLNLFWLLPFANYTVRNSSEVAESGTFALINEGLFNQYAERFSWDKIITFSSDVFSGLPFTDLKTKTSSQVHPTVSYVEIGEKVPLQLFAPLILVVMGVMYVLFQLRNKKIAGIGVIGIFFISLFLLRKQYPPAGFIFEMIGKYVPVFNMLMRFVGTKINIFLSMSMAILIGLGILGFFSIFHKIFKRELPTAVITGVFITLFVCLFSLPLLDFFKGHMLFDLLQVSVPEAYERTVTRINNDPIPGRVVHLPVSRYSYWKAYSWGYFGSAFMNFMLDKPLIDKTFSPGRLENDYFDIAVMEIVHNADVANPQNLSERAERFHNLLVKSGVRYLIFDESVGMTIAAKGLGVWDPPPAQTSALVVKEMEDLGLVTKESEETIPLAQIAKKYHQELSNLPPGFYFQPKVMLFTVKGAPAPVRSVTEAVNVDPSIENILAKPWLTDATDKIQSPSYSFRMYSFWQPKKKVVYEKDRIALVPNEFPQSAQPLKVVLPEKALSASPASSLATQVFMEKTSTGINISLEKVVPYVGDKNATPTTSTVTTFTVNDLSLEPEVNQKSYNLFLNDWHVLGDQVTSNYRLQVGDVVLPIPADSNAQPQYLGTVLVPDETVAITLLEKENKDKNPEYIDPTRFLFSKELPCLSGAPGDYSWIYDPKNFTLKVDTKQGAVCFVLGLDLQEVTTVADATQNYLELSMMAQQQTLGQDEVTETFSSMQSQQAIREVVNELPNYASFSVCLQSSDVANCLNDRRAVKGTVQPQKVVVTSEQLFSSSKVNTIFEILSNNQQKNHFELKDVQIDTFAPMVSKTVTFDNTAQPQSSNSLSTDPTLQIPYVFSHSSYFRNAQTDAWQPKLRNECLHTVGDHRQGRFRTFKEGQAGGFLSYGEDCYQSTFVLLPWLKDVFYFSSVDYHLYTGNQPQWIAADPFDLERSLLSQNDFYPQIPGAKDLQVADKLGLSLASAKERVKDSLQHRSMIQAHTMYPDPGNVTRDAFQFFEIYQPHDNQTLLELNNLNVFALPSNWEDLYLESGKTDLQFDAFEVKAAQKMLPSLWKITIEKPRSSQQDQILLSFDQAFDDQWQLFSTEAWWKPWLGQDQLSAEHVRVNGWNNGWIINSSELSDEQTQTFYVFYTAERFTLMGWGVTIITVLGVGVWLVLRPRQPQL